MKTKAENLLGKKQKQHKCLQRKLFHISKGKKIKTIKKDEIVQWKNLRADWLGRLNEVTCKHLLWGQGNSRSSGKVIDKIWIFRPLREGLWIILRWWFPDLHTHQIRPEVLWAEVLCYSGQRREKQDSPGWCGSVDWVLTCEPRGHWFDSQSGHMPWLQARSPVGGMWEATTHWCFSPSLSPSLPLSLKINKYKV